MHMMNFIDTARRVDEAERFLNLLFGNVAGDRYGYLWTKQDKATYPYLVSDASARKAMAVRAIELSDAGFDVYVGVNCGDEPAAPDKRYTKEQITVQIATVTDVDCEGGGHISGAKQIYPPNFYVAKSFLPFDVSFLVDSGFGLHGYCLYSEPIVVSDDNREDCIARNRRFIDTVRARAGVVFSRAIDGVGDLPRVLRVPGTYNFKGGKDNAPLCKLVEVNDIRFTTADLDVRLDALKSPAVSIHREPPKPPRKIHLDGDEPTDIERAIAMLDKIPCADLTYEDWLSVGMCLKNNGNDVSDWTNWSRADERFKDGETERKWQGFNGGGLTIATLHKFAAFYGYSEKDFRREWYNLRGIKPARRPTNGDSAPADVASVFADMPDIAKKLNSWQKINGEIPPNVLPEIRAAAEYVESLTPENFTVEDMREDARLNKVALCTYYLPSVGENFFATARAAKKRATAAIKRLEKKKPPKKPSRRVIALSNLTITPIRKAVQSLEIFVQQIHFDFLNAKSAAESAEREQKRIATTTKTLIKDCPVDLILPQGVKFDDKKGISRFDWDKPPKFQSFVSVCATPMVPTAIFREPGKHTTSYEVSIKSRGVWRRVKVDGDELADSKKILRLARDGGALVTSATHLCKYFSQIIKENEDRLPEITCYAQPGWTDKTFTNFAYPTGDEGYIVRRAGFAFDEEFGTAGDAEEWKKYFLDACKNGGAPARIFLGTALAAPLVRPLVVLNSQCHLDGRNNNGKTALNKLGASIFGNPLKLIRTFAATQKNLQSVAAASRDLPAFVDELETANKKMLDDLPTMVYDFAQGKTNQANKRNGDMREALEFSGTRLTTAERPLLKKQDQRGAFKRLVQIHCDTLFDEDFGTDLHYVTENNYGHFGRPWVEFVTANLKEIKGTYRDLFKLAATYKFNVEKTLLKSVVAAAVALQFFLICVGAKETFDDKAAAEDIVAIVATLPTPADMDESTRALDDLRGTFAQKIKFFTREHNDIPEQINTVDITGGDEPAVTYDVFGKIFKNGEVAILPTVLRRWIENDLGYAALEPIVADWAKKGLLHVGNGRGAGMRYQTRISGGRQWTYRFNPNVLYESDEIRI